MNQNTATIEAIMKGYTPGKSISCRMQERDSYLLGTVMEPAEFKDGKWVLMAQFKCMLPLHTSVEVIWTEDYNGTFILPKPALDYEKPDDLG